MKILDIFLKNIKCVCCGREDNDFGICKDCFEKFTFLKGKTCEKCSTLIKSGKVCIDCKGNNYSFEKTFSIFEYSGKLRSAILRLKNNGEKYIAKPLSILIDEYFRKLNLEYDVIIPMPIHPNRKKERGFNQCDLLLKNLSKSTRKVNNNIVIRCKDTPHQTGLSRDNRKVNLTNAFKVVKKENVKGKIVVIFDDIYTTGTSMNECAKALIDSGASKVYGLCLARTPITLDNYLIDNEKIDEEKILEKFII